jgi:hypothetical protein
MSIVGTIANAEGGSSVRAKLNALINGQQHNGFVAGNWYSCGVGVLGTGAAPGTGVMVLYPFILEQAVTISNLGARVTILSAAGNFHMGIYAADPVTKQPTGLPVATTGTGATGLSTAATGTITGAPSGGNVALQPGLYWTALICDNATAAFTSYGTAGNQYIANLIGSSAIASVLGTTNAMNGYKVTGLTFSNGLVTMTGASFTENMSGSTIAAIAMQVVSIP